MRPVVVLFLSSLLLAGCSSGIDTAPTTPQYTVTLPASADNPGVAKPSQPPSDQTPILNCGSDELEIVIFVNPGESQTYDFGQESYTANNDGGAAGPASTSDPYAVALSVRTADPVSSVIVERVANTPQGDGPELPDMIVRLDDASRHELLTNSLVFYGDTFGIGNGHIYALGVCTTKIGLPARTL